MSYRLMLALYLSICIQEKLTINQVRYLVLLLVAYPLGFILRVFLHYSTTGPVIRHVFSSSCGLLFSIICFKWQTLYLLAMIGVCYTLLLFTPRNQVHKVTMVFSLLIIAVAHTYRMMLDYGGYKLDFTGPMMVFVQRVTYVAFAYYDGTKKSEELTKDQYHQQIKEIPSPLEFFSYNFSFLTFLAGPIVTYREYIDFITGDNVNSKRSETQPNDPSVVMHTVTTLLKSIAFLAVYVSLKNVFTTEYLLDPDIWLPWRHLAIMLYCFQYRCRYYFTFLIVESTSVNAGLGFNGYDDKGCAKWDLVRCVNARKFEIGVNVREQSTAWNSLTSNWLRRIAYERSPVSPTMSTFLLSALWHGFYPGYYIMFVFFALCAIVGRKLRRLLFEQFQSPRWVKVSYDVFGTFLTCSCKDFGQMCFVILFIDKIFVLTKYVSQGYYYFSHIILVLCLLLFLPNKKSVSKSKTNEQEKLLKKD